MNKTDNNDTVSSSTKIDDDVLQAVVGGQMTNSTEIVYASTYVPFDSSF